LTFHGGDYEQCHNLGCDAVWLFLKTDVSEERIVFIVRVTRISELGNISSSLIHLTLMVEATYSSETSVFKKPHGVTSEKATFFVVTVAKTSNLTQH
jgi:hypothetical protein